MATNSPDLAASAIEVAKAAPPVGVGGALLFGIPVETWLLIPSVVWTLFLIIDKFPTVVVRFRDGYRWVKEKLRDNRK